MPSAAKVIIGSALSAATVIAGAVSLALSGTAQQTADGNAYGSWESADKKWLVIGDRSEGAVEIEFNLLLGTKPGQ